jgi:uncharacterized protein YydD (DUF2326 family)
MDLGQSIDLANEKASKLNEKYPHEDEWIEVIRGVIVDYGGTVDSSLSFGRSVKKWTKKLTGSGGDILKVSQDAESKLLTFRDEYENKAEWEYTLGTLKSNYEQRDKNDNYYGPRGKAQSDHMESVGKDLKKEFVSRYDVVADAMNEVSLALEAEIKRKRKAIKKFDAEKKKKPDLDVKEREEALAAVSMASKWLNKFKSVDDPLRKEMKARKKELINSIDNIIKARKSDVKRFTTDMKNTYTKQTKVNPSVLVEHVENTQSEITHQSHRVQELEMQVQDLTNKLAEVTEVLNNHSDVLRSIVVNF